MSVYRFLSQDEDEKNYVFFKCNNFTDEVSNKVREALRENFSLGPAEKQELQVFLKVAAAFAQTK